MAGDWIKMRTALATDRAVMVICDLTGLDEFAVVGRLHAIWVWAGEHTVTGDVRGVTQKTIDRIVRHEKFSDAMIAAEWLESLPDGGVRFVRWKKHNTKAARERALAADRKARQRAKSHASDRDGKRDTTVTSHALEKRRGEESKKRNNTKGDTPLNPQAFEQFWQVFPALRKTKKGKAAAAFKRAAKRESPEKIIAAAIEYAASSVAKTQFVQGPEPWLNGDCWNDDRAAWNTKGLFDEQPKRPNRTAPSEYPEAGVGTF